MYKIRFHLGRGSNYMKWQIAKFGEEVNYYDPQEYQLIMYNCKLHNVSRVANKIFSGNNKTVCAWVTCDSVEIVPYFLQVDTINLDNVVYNPRKNPYWSLNSKNIDGSKYQCLVTKNNKVYIKYE